jgi:hypothetical protein
VPGKNALAAGYFGIILIPVLSAIPSTLMRLD